MGMRKRLSRLLYHYYLQKPLVTQYGLKTTAAFNCRMLHSLCTARRNRRLYYHQLSETELKSTRRSNRVFIFGSGYSLNDISQEQWRHIAQYDTIGFNAFVYQKWIPVNYHLIRGWGEGASVYANWKAMASDLGGLIESNPFYENTVFIYQSDLIGQVSHSLLQFRCLPRHAKIFPYKTNREDKLPDRDLKQGLLHQVGTLSDAIHFAFCLGWREIVLVGVDLYDTRYFWLKSDETFAVDPKTGKRNIGQVADRGQRYDQPHSTATNGVIDLIEEWKRHLQKYGVSLSVHNPRSLLTEVIPVYLGHQPVTI